MLTLIGLVLLLLGRHVFRVLAFPLLFLFLMVPLPQSLVNVVAFPLQLHRGRLGGAGALPAAASRRCARATSSTCANTQLFVADACSGLRSLMALITLGVVFAYFFRTSLGERIADRGLDDPDRDRGQRAPRRR